MSKIYKGKLTVKKVTKKFVVYGNEDLHAQYLPKAIFTDRKLKKHPPVGVIRILVPNPVKSKQLRERKQNGRGKAARLTLSKKGTKNTPP